MDAKQRWYHQVEGTALALALGAMMVLPLLEIVLRALFNTGISNQASIVQHLVLVSGMIGAMIATKRGQLLSLGISDLVLSQAWKARAKIASSAFAATVCAWLCVAAVQFVASERGAGTLIAYGIPVWAAELMLPAGFAVITVRIILTASDAWTGRGVALALAALLALLMLFPPLSVHSMVLPAFVVLALAAFLGAPIFSILGGAGLILFWRDASPIASLTVDHYGLVTNPTLPTVPLFTLAGYFLAEGGASKRLIRVFQTAVGHLRGGAAILVALVCAFFTSFTGASGVTILALGALLMPVLLSAGYSKRNALGLVTGTGSIGLLLPPSLPLIFYGVIAGVEIKTMFLGGVVPGMLLVALVAAWGVSQAPVLDGARPLFNAAEARRAVWEAKWELLVPIVAFVALFSGLATPVEAAAVTALYAFTVETLVYRDLHLLRDVPRVIADAGVLVGGVLLILGVALGFTNYLAFAEVPAHAVEWVTASVHSKWMFLLLLNLFLIVVGMLMDIYSAIVIVVPLIVPLGRAFGIEPVHLGIIFLTNLELGYLTPPVGANLFLASLRFNEPIARVFRSVVPILILFVIAVVLVTYVPALTTALPRWFGG